MSAAEKHTWEPFHDARLSPQQNKACEMLFNGWARSEIADELDITDRHLSQVFCHARKRGVDVPKSTTRPDAPVSLKHLIELRTMYQKLGHERGIPSLIAERTGLNAMNVYMRLYYFDRRQQGAKL